MIRARRARILFMAEALERLRSLLVGPDGASVGDPEESQKRDREIALEADPIAFAKSGVHRTARCLL